jgi:RNA polymerase sigma-70 factor (ECF subfamily)
MAEDSASQATSTTLLARLRQAPADQQAWAAFVDRYGPLIYTWSRRWGLQDADARDVTQMVLLKLAQKMPVFHYDPGGSFRAWLKILTQHAWSDFVAARQRPGRGSGDSDAREALEAVEARDDLVQRLQEEFDRELLEEATRRVRQRVDPRSWEAFRLTALEGLSGAAVGERLQMQVATVFKAKSRVQQLLQEEVRLLNEG